MNKFLGALMLLCSTPARGRNKLLTAGAGNRILPLL